MMRSTLLALWIACALALAGCASIRSPGPQASILIVSSPELKEAAKKQQEDIHSLQAEWEKTKGLIRALDQQQESELQLIGHEVALMGSEANAARQIVKQGTTGTAILNTEKVLGELKTTDTNRLNHFYALAKQPVNAIPSAIERRKLLLAAWTKVTSETALPKGIRETLVLRKSESERYFLDDRLEDEYIAAIQRRSDEGKPLREDERKIMNWVMYLAASGGDYYRDVPQMIMVEHVQRFFSDLYDIRNGNWKEIDLRLKLVGDLISYQRTYMENDIEAVNWETLARAAGRLVDAAKKLKKD